MERVLVTGGAGFIGSHVALQLAEAGIPYLVLDDLSGGHPDAVDQSRLVVGDMRDPGLLDDLLARHDIGAVLHLAGSIEVGRSVAEPIAFYDNNVVSTILLLRAMARRGVSRLVFSSSAAIYAPSAEPLAEDALARPLSPYGMTKLHAEQAIADCCRSYGLSAVALRYFNAAGNDPEGRAGERHKTETHLIPLALDAALGRRPCLDIHGADYPTPDGTCVRDYVHVEDIARAHLDALRWTRGNPGVFLPLNLGLGYGFSVLEVVETVRAVTGLPVPVRMAGRRVGDAARLVAEASAAARFLGWSPRHAALATIVEHAWRYRRLTAG